MSIAPPPSPPCSCLHRGEKCSRRMFGSTPEEHATFSSASLFVPSECVLDKFKENIIKLDECIAQENEKSAEFWREWALGPIGGLKQNVKIVEIIRTELESVDKIKDEINKAEEEHARKLEGLNKKLEERKEQGKKTVDDAMIALAREMIKE